ncbi:MAG: undecaprenyl/decaprenyl-phosphate alpha-N-acetylglucosaminyl 1-phosphate transferase [Cyanobacteria bacterium P01_F01_bin.53]
MHQQPMVRLGGMAIWVATLLPIVCFWCVSMATPFQDLFSPEDLSTLLLILLGGSGFFLIGLADDVFELSPFNRLWMQAAIAAALWWCGLRIEAVMLPGMAPFPLGWVSLPVTIVWLAGVVNAINWMDGLDGLAAGVASIGTGILVMLAIVMAQPVPALVGAALLGSLVGFLYYNYNPADIFMGDGGSYFIGFLLASLCIVGPQRLDDSFATLLPLMILAVPLGDMTWVILARLYRKKSPFYADNRHLHHRLLQMDFTHRATVWVMYGLTLATGCLTFVVSGFIDTWIYLLGIVFLVGAVIVRSRRVQGVPKQNSDVVTRKALWSSENL